MNTTIDQIKETVKSHKVLPFRVGDISCEKNRLIIADKFSATNTKSLMETLGIRSNLSKDIFSKPEENWDAIRSALRTVDSERIYNCIVDTNDIVRTLISTKHKEGFQLDFDNRIDQLVDTINDSTDNTFKDIFFNPDDCSVQISSTNKSEVDCGLGDLWNFGTSTTISHNSQQFANFFLRLVCSNGMTTRENVAYRIADTTKNIGKQFIKFATGNNFAASIRPRVDKLRKSRASLYEVRSVADTLDKEQKALFMPEYSNLVADFKNKGIDVSAITSKRSRFVYTNENLYDIFNLATNLASHQREDLGVETAGALNKVAGEMFVKGPNLDFNVLDIYNN